LEREFQLCKNIPGFTLEGIRATPIRLLDWHYGRMIRDIQEKQDRAQE